MHAIILLHIQGVLNIFQFSIEFSDFLWRSRDKFEFFFFFFFRISSCLLAFYIFENLKFFEITYVVGSSYGNEGLLVGVKKLAFFLQQLKWFIHSFLYVFVV